MNNFKRTICALSALVLAPAYAGAQTINTIPLWSGSTTIAPFGPPNTQTYGQTITVPAGLPVLQYFSFEMNVPAAEVFRGEVYAWNGTSATGPNLFESAPMSTAGTGIQL